MIFAGNKLSDWLLRWIKEKQKDNENQLFFLQFNFRELAILSISRGINFRDYASQFFSRGFSFTKMAKKRENAKVSPRKVDY